MRRTPEGLLVVGDAVASFNPIYGRGMTVAAIEAMVLRDCLIRGDRGLPRRFLRASARWIRVAWQTAVGSDLALPEVDGPRPLSMRLSKAFLEGVPTAVEADPVVAGQFMRVIGMADPPARLPRPSILRRVMRISTSSPTARSSRPTRTGTPPCSSASSEASGWRRASRADTAPSVPSFAGSRLQDFGRVHARRGLRAHSWP
ncbi:hypothetical protein [Mycobacterium palustre]|nr:hypothetical protein [Mycobacterium palustre]MCV7101724.1 hypothetical protein [Mycobacterium palustre]